MSECGAIRPRLGVLLVTSGWFREIGLQGSASELSTEVEKVAHRILDRVRTFADPIGGQVLFTIESAGYAGREIAAAGVDAVILVPLMWCEDSIPRAALSFLQNIPLILWSFSPTSSLGAIVPFQAMLLGSGLVGTFQLSGMLKREGVRFVSVTGHLDDDSAWSDIRIHARAHAAARRIRRCRIGVLPFPCDQMSATWVDEFDLRARHGITLRWIELERLRHEAQGFTDDEVLGMQELLVSRGVAIEVDRRNIEEGIRYALALERVADTERLDGIAMNDVIPEMHQCFGLRPCLWNPRMSQKGVEIAMEADIASCAAMIAVRLFTGLSPFYAEPLSADHAGGAMLMGHAGYHDASCAAPGSAVRVVEDVEYRNSDRFSGAAILFALGSGPVTLLNSVWNGSTLAWTILEGESLPGRQRLEGNCHFVFRPRIPLANFINSAVETGVSQHWIAVPGHRMRGLARLAEALGAGCHTLETTPLGQT